MDGGKVAINKYFQDGVHFVPGSITIKSGCSLTFAYATKNDPDPHTFSIVTPAQLPKTLAQVNNCRVCDQIAAKHIKYPNQPPAESDADPTLLFDLLT